MTGLGQILRQMNIVSRMWAMLRDGCVRHAIAYAVCQHRNTQVKASTWNINKIIIDVISCELVPLDQLPFGRGFHFQLKTIIIALSFSVVHTHAIFVRKQSK